MTELLKLEAFRELLLDMPDLNFCLIGMVGQHKPAVSSPLANPPAEAPSRHDDSESEDEDRVRFAPPGRYGRYGKGRTLG